MASYSSPSSANIQDWTGVNVHVLAQTSTALTTLLTSLITLAEAETALEVTSSRFTSTGLSSYEVSALQQAVAYRVAASFLVAPAVQDATGTEQPLLMDGRDLLEMRGELLGHGDKLAILVANGEGSIENRILTSFSSDTEDERVFTRGMDW